MKQANDRARRFQTALLGLALLILFDTGLVQNKWGSLSVSGSEALAQELSGSWVTLTQDCKWPNTALQCKINGKFKVSNPGGQKALSSKARFFLSDDSTLEEASDILLKEIKVGSLNPGQSKTISLKVNLPSGNSASDKFVIGLVDAGNSVPEADETNNVIPYDMMPSGREFFPFAQGDTWEFQGNILENGALLANYINTRTVTGTKVINGVTATVFTETNPSNSGTPMEEYLVKDTQGITYWGGNEETDFSLSKMVPFQQVYFPIQLGSLIKKSFKKIDLGQDLDGDGVNETTDVTSTVTVAGFEEVVVPAGSFSDSVRIETKATLKVALSGYHRKITVKATMTEWFASGIGPVKRTTLVEAEVAGENFSEEVTEELRGFIVGKQRKGIVSVPIVKGIATANSDTENPGRSAIGSDGTNYLIVFYREIGSPPGLYGVILSESGLVLNSFVISPDGGGCSVWPCKSTGPAIAFDGANYLVVFQRGENVFGMRISPSGTVLDDAPGFQISSGYSEWRPVVAFDGANYLVVWDQYDNVLGSKVLGARVTPGGQILDQAPIFIAVGANPSMAFDGTNYFVVWIESDQGSPSNIFGARITPDGINLDPEGIPISTAPGDQMELQIIFDRTNYFVVWTDRRKDPNAQYPPRLDIFGARIKPDGTLLDGPPETGGIPINTSSFPKQHPRVSFDGVHYFVTWEYSYFYEPPIGIFGARVSTEGNLIDGPPDQIGLPISGPPLCYACRFVHPNILFNGEAYLATWANNSEVYGTAKDILGALIFP